MKKHLISILLVSITLFAAEESNGMLPSITANPKNSEKLWHTARNASCQVEFAADAEAESLKIDNKGGGYGNYRCFLKLAPGKYTVSVTASGKSDKSNIGLEIYSFNAKGMPRNIGMKYYPEGVLDQRELCFTFTVPQDSVRQRLALVVNGKGKVLFSKLSLVSGVPSAQSVKKKLK